MLFHKIYLCIIILSVADWMPLHAQYKSIFGEHTTEWVFEWHNLDFGGQDTVYVQKDTIVNDVFWRKILVRNNSFIYKGGLLREDTILGKVWYKGLYFLNDELDTTEFLLFDFALEESNIFDVSNMWTGYQGTTTVENTVDTVYYIDGLKHIQFAGNYDSEHPSEPYLFIEGIGGNLGVLWKQYSGGLQAQYLLCSYKDGIKTSYSNIRHMGECEILIMSKYIEFNTPNELTIYPNPCNDFATIQLKSALPLYDINISIFDLTGKIIYKTHSGPYLDLSSISPGLYCILIETSNGNNFTKLLIKI